MRIGGLLASHIVHHSHRSRIHHGVTSRSGRGYGSSSGLGSLWLGLGITAVVLVVMITLIVVVKRRISRGLRSFLRD
ncbi:hypothetical protein [Streptomyces sp. NBC_01190]|uniref:hypothetical protein n=1 Tax=Streptomyces sp. NBC_01190 TaxID=2903767 RepID=UPI0038640C95|nr:hypothetical protein OG519_14285 [Streptomyces sp. NBC_01190]